MNTQCGSHIFVLLLILFNIIKWNHQQTVYLWLSGDHLRILHTEPPFQDVVM